MTLSDSFPQSSTAAWGRSAPVVCAERRPAEFGHKRSLDVGARPSIVIGIGYGQSCPDDPSHAIQKPCEGRQWTYTGNAVLFRNAVNMSMTCVEMNHSSERIGMFPARNTNMVPSGHTGLCRSWKARERACVSASKCSTMQVTSPPAI